MEHLDTLICVLCCFSFQWRSYHARALQLHSIKTFFYGFPLKQMQSFTEQLSTPVPGQGFSKSSEHLKSYPSANPRPYPSGFNTITSSTNSSFGLEYRSNGRPRKSFNRWMGLVYDGAIDIFPCEIGYTPDANTIMLTF